LGKIGLHRREKTATAFIPPIQAGRCGTWGKIEGFLQLPEKRCKHIIYK
jgi:hypothetical protein